MSNCAFVQVRDIKTRKREKINSSGLRAEFRFRQYILPLTYINQDNKDPSEIQPQHLITLSGVLLLMGRAKEGEFEVI